MSAQIAPDEALAIEATFRRYREDPVAFVRECFGVEPDPWQIEVLAAFPTTPRIAMQACKGPGKTCCLAWLIWNFLLNEMAQINAVSLSGSNVRNNLWKELAFWRDKCPWLKTTFAMTATRIFVPSTADADYERHWFCELRTWSKDADDSVAGETLQGLHSKFCMIVLDESGGMPDALMVAAEGIMANADPGGRKHVVQAGNPTRLEGPLYRASTRDKTLWKVVAISGDPDDPKRSTRVDLKWAADMIRVYGRDHAYVLVNVLGLFPPSSYNALIGPDELGRAVGRHLAKSQFDRAARIIGVDVARYGDDETVIWPRQGLAAFEPIVQKNAHPDDTAGAIAQLIEEWGGADAVMVDATGGFGDGVVDSLARIGIVATRVQFAGKPIQPKFFNKRSEMLWNLVEWVRAGGAVAPGPWADHLVEELTVLEYCFKKDLIALEEKELAKIRIGRSPDYSDALGCTFAFPVTAGVRDPLQGLVGSDSFSHAKTDYSPMDRA